MAKKYKVIRSFRDLSDNDHVYEVGHVYPRGNKKANKDRIQELSTKNNRNKRIYIAEIEEDPNEEGENTDKK